MDTIDRSDTLSKSNDSIDTKFFYTSHQYSLQHIASYSHNLQKSKINE